MKAKPKRNDVTGQLYRLDSEKRTRTKTITLYALFASDHGTFLLRPHVFKTIKKARTPSEWASFLQRNYTTEPRDDDNRPPILANILAGLDERTQKQWRIYRIIGWINSDNTFLANSRTRAKRNKTKQKGR